MEKVTTSKVIPKESDILNGFSHVDYLDVHTISKTTNKTIKEISLEIMEMPTWVDFLLKLRNSIVKIFGLKVGKQNDKQETFFELIKETNNEIIMGEVDKHLDFRTSIMVDKLKKSISFITVVHFNNLWGKIYFSLIKPFHMMILRSLLIRQLERG